MAENIIKRTENPFCSDDCGIYMIRCNSCGGFFCPKCGDGYGVVNCPECGPDAKGSKCYADASKYDEKEN